MLLGANRFGGPATPALPGWGKKEAIHADGKSPSRICVHREPEPLQIRESKPLIHAEGVNASRICVHRDPGPLQISGSTNVHRHEGERKRER